MIAWALRNYLKDSGLVLLGDCGGESTKQSLSCNFLKPRWIKNIQSTIQVNVKTK